MGHRDIWGSDSRKWKKMCPCFNVKDELEQLLAEKPEENIPEPIEESEEVVLEEPGIESGSVVVPGKENPTNECPTRPNPVDFIIKLIIKLIEYGLKVFRNRTR